MLKRSLALSLFALVVFMASAAIPAPVETAPTYQGELIDNGQAVNDASDVDYELWSRATDDTERMKVTPERHAQYAVNAGHVDDAEGPVSSRDVRSGPVDERDPAARESTATQLTLKNESDVGVYVQKQQTGCTGWPGWFAVKQSGSSLKLWSRCEDCTCSEIDNGECSTTPCPGPCVPPAAVELGRGETITYEWRGAYWEQVTRQGVACYREAVPPADEQLSVEFCWGDGRTSSGPPPHGEVTGKQCETVSFEYGSETEVAHSVY